MPRRAPAARLIGARGRPQVLLARSAGLGAGVSAGTTPGTPPNVAAYFLS